MNTLPDIEKIEIEIVLEAIFQRCGYDFRHYALRSIHRGLLREVENLGLKRISELLPVILYEPTALNRLLQNLSISVTEFFRDPAGYKALVDNVFPVLRSYPFIKVWHAGCSTGKEVYSLAILLQEAGLLERSLIYATDFNHTVLAQAKEGIYSREEIVSLMPRYRQAGGQRFVQEYFNIQYNAAKVIRPLRERITFAHHNLVSDSVFGEMQLIVCKNVLIYFNKKLKARVIQLFQDSLSPSGHILLGTTEPLDPGHLKSTFSSVCFKQRLYRKCASLPSAIGDT